MISHLPLFVLLGSAVPVGDTVSSLTCSAPALLCVAAQDAPQPVAEPPKPAAVPIPQNPPSATAAPSPADWIAVEDSWREGRYEQAIERYQALASASRTPVDRVKAAVGESRCLQMLGRYGEARDRLEQAAAEGDREAQWQVLRGSLSRDLGHYDEALSHFEIAIAAAPADPTGRLERAQLLEYLGRRDEAIEVYRWFENLVVQRKDLLPDARWLTDVGAGFYRYSFLAKKSLVSRTRYVLTQMFQTAYERVDRSYWPARIAAGELLRSKFNNDESDGSLSDYVAALHINDRLPQAFVGVGEVALEDWEFEKVEGACEKAFAVNPHYAPARHLLARCRLLERRYDEAEKEAQKALAVNPNDLEAMSILAAAHACRFDETEVERWRKAVEAINPRCALFYRTMGDSLGGLRQYEESEKYYLRAVEFEPSDPNPRTELGLMCMQWGKEDKAREALQAAWDLDPFNARTLNTLKLLDALQSFQTVKTPHFIVRYDEKTDPGLGKLVGDILERVGPQVCEDFGVEPDFITTIECFPSGQAFGVRVTGKPWIITVGASTGQVIALTAPRGDPGLLGAYDMEAVLRHEYTHTVTLAVTRNRIPHWLTEGLAVWEEDGDRPFTWCQLLAASIRRNDLFTLETINWGFMRPRRPDDRQRAYAQAEWMCEFIVERFGFDAVSKLLARYREGDAPEAALQHVLQLSSSEFNQTFAAWAREQAASWGLDLRPTEDLESLRKQLAEMPQDKPDADLLGRMARAELDNGSMEHAALYAQEALKADEKQWVALEILAAVTADESREAQNPATRDNLEKGALTLLNRLLEVRPDSAVAHRELGRILLRQGDPEAAIEHFTRLKSLVPVDTAPDEGLAAIYLKRGETDKALAALLMLARQKSHDADLYAKIGQMLSEAGRWSEARYWSERALIVDPYNAKRRFAWAQELMAHDDGAAALDHLRFLLQINTTEYTYFDIGAICAHKMGEKELAEAWAKKAVEINPNASSRALLPSSQGS